MRRYVEQVKARIDRELAFNSLFEMPNMTRKSAGIVLYIALSILYLRCRRHHRSRRQEDVDGLSILYLRCAALAGLCLGTPRSTLSILYLRCGWHPEGGPHSRDLCPFQFSI